VAVSDVRVDGVRLEGVGVEPDVTVALDSTQSARGVDTQFDHATEVLLQALAAREPVPVSQPATSAAILPGVSHERSTIIFSGRVQGVGFRATTERIAEGFAVAGWVRNQRDGSVLCVAEGEVAEVERFIAAIKHAMHAYIRDVQITRSPGTGEFSDFCVRH
jgi:acylphosphatase